MSYKEQFEIAEKRMDMIREIDDSVIYYFVYPNAPLWDNVWYYNLQFLAKEEERSLVNWGMVLRPVIDLTHTHTFNDITKKLILKALFEKIHHMVIVGPDCVQIENIMTKHIPYYLMPR